MYLWHTRRGGHTIQPYPIMQFEYSGLWLFPIAALSCGISYYFYRTDKSMSSAPGRIRTLLTVLRATVLFMAGGLLLRPFVQIDRSQLLRPVIVFLQDGSRSVPAVSADSLYWQTTYPEQLRQLRDRVGEDYEVRTYVFGNEARETDSLSFAAGETDYSRLFDQMQELYGDENIGAVVLATDGNHTRGEALPYAARRLQTAAPFYTVVLGDTTKRSDLFLTDLRYNEKAFVNKISQIALSINWQGIAAQGTVLRLYAGDSLVGEKKLQLRARHGSLAEMFSFVPLRPGSYKMRAVADRPAGDQIGDNNSVVFYLTVYESRKKILFCNTFISPDAGAFFRAFSSNTSYEVEQVRTIAPKQLEKCDLVVLSGADSQKTLRTELEKRKIPLLWIRGMDDIRRGEYATGIDLGGVSPSADEVAPLANPAFKLFAIDEELTALARKSMPVRVPYGKYSVSDARLQTAAFQQIKGVETDRPLIAVFKRDAMKQVILLGSGYWHWRTQCFEDNNNFEIFDRFANTLSEYLLANSGKDRFIVNSPRTASENEDVRISAQVLDAAMQLTEGAEVSLVLTDSAGTAQSYDFVAQATEYNLSLGRLHPGEYRYAAKAVLGSESFAQSGIIRVAQSNAELIFSSANIEALRMLDDEHDGALFSAKNMAAVADSIQAHPAKAVYSASTEYVELVDLGWLIALLAGLLFAEWILRKYFGGY